MSRSYKKSPYATDKTMCRSGKDFANRRVRHAIDLRNGNLYKKIYPSWDIRDFAWRDTLESYLLNVSKDEIAKAKDEWERAFKRK